MHSETEKVLELVLDKNQGVLFRPEFQHLAKCQEIISRLPTLPMAEYSNSPSKRPVHISVLVLPRLHVDPCRHPLQRRVLLPNVPRHVRVATLFYPHGVLEVEVITEIFCVGVAYGVVLGENDNLVALQVFQRHPHAVEPSGPDGGCEVDDELVV